MVHPHEAGAQVWLEITRYLRPDAATFRRLARVCRKFYAIFTSDAVWSTLNINGVESHFYDTYHLEMRKCRCTLNPACRTCVFEFITEELCSDSYYHGRFFTNIEVPTDRTLIMCAVKVNGLALKYAPKNLQDDREVVMTAVSTPLRVHHGAKFSSHGIYRKSGYPIRVPLFFASQRLRQDECILRAAIDTVGESILWSSAEHKTNRDLMLYAISRHCTLRHSKTAMKYFKGDREVIEAALAISGQTIEETDFLGDRELVLKAVKKDGTVLGKVDGFLRDDKTVVTAAIQQCPGAIIWASDRLRSDYHIVIKALDHPLLGGTELRQGKLMDVLGQERWIRSSTQEYDTEQVVKDIHPSLLENDQIAIAILRKEPALLFKMPPAIRSSPRMKAIARKYAIAHQCVRYDEAVQQLVDKGEITKEERDTPVVLIDRVDEYNYLHRDQMECKLPVHDNFKYLRRVQATQMWPTNRSGATCKERLQL